jgi:Domain of unknown function (DUF1905)
MQFTFTAQLWLYSGKGAWHFVTLPRDAADEIKFFNPTAKGFMPIKVSATLGETTWKTSIFPDSKSGSYLLAVKADVRKKENLSAGDTVHVSVSVV